MYNTLSPKRIVSIDALRGITIWVMVFVNAVAGMSKIPGWMKHMPPTADGLTFADVVFPAFIFIAGMSIPFALNKKFTDDPHHGKLRSYIVFRSIGLLVFGVYMVNADTGGAPNMPIGIAAWELIFYVCAFLVWQVYRNKSRRTVLIYRSIGIAGLVILGLVFRAGKEGTEYLVPRWWGILGMIGWAYLFTTFAYQICKGTIAGMLIFIGLNTVFYMLTHYFNWVPGPAQNSTDMTIMSCGVIVSLIMFDLTHPARLRHRAATVLLFAVILVSAAILLRPFYSISKVGATPSWGFDCAAICSVIYLFLYWLIDLHGVKRWTEFFRPAAENPLLTYMIPDIIYALSLFLHVRIFPESWTTGMKGVITCALYASVVMLIVKGLNRLHIRLQL